MSLGDYHVELNVVVLQYRPTDAQNTLYQLFSNFVLLLLLLPPPPPPPQALPDSEFCSVAGAHQTGCDSRNIFSKL
jgi:hypothetical protein